MKELTIELSSEDEKGLCLVHLCINTSRSTECSAEHIVSPQWGIRYWFTSPTCSEDLFLPTSSITASPTLSNTVEAHNLLSLSVHGVVKSRGSEVSLPSFDYSLFHLLALWPWTDYLTSPCFSFLICKRRIIMVPSIIKWKKLAAKNLDWGLSIKYSSHLLLAIFILFALSSFI